MKSLAARGRVNILDGLLQPPVLLCSKTDNSPSTVATRKSNADQLIFYRPTGRPLGSIGTSQHKGDKALYTIINHPNQPSENLCADGVGLYLFLFFFFLLCKQSSPPRNPTSPNAHMAGITRGVLTSRSPRKPVLLTRHWHSVLCVSPDVTPTDDASDACCPGGSV